MLKNLLLKIIGKIITGVNLHDYAGELTIDECTNAVKHLKTNKAPGSDGLTPEFYKTFWDDVKY